jgi:hypothetical protein
MMRVSLCSYCKHRISRTPTCAAFPDRIPREILFGHQEHLAPVDGDHGIQFEQADGLTEAAKEMIAEMIQLHGPKATAPQT